LTVFSPKLEAILIWDFQPGHLKDFSDIQTQGQMQTPSFPLLLVTKFGRHAFIDMPKSKIHPEQQKALQPPSITLRLQNVIAISVTSCQATSANGASLVTML